MGEISSLTEQSVGLLDSAQWYRDINGMHTASCMRCRGGEEIQKRGQKLIYKRERERDERASATNEQRWRRN